MIASNAVAVEIMDQCIGNMIGNEGPFVHIDKVIKISSKSQVSLRVICCLQCSQPFITRVHSKLIFTTFFLDAFFYFFHIYIFKVNF